MVERSAGRSQSGRVVEHATQLRRRRGLCPTGSCFGPGEKVASGPQRPQADCEVHHSAGVTLPTVRMLDSEGTVSEAPAVNLERVGADGLNSDGEAPNAPSAAVCPICLENFKEYDVVVRWPCAGNHGYHAKCIRTWCRQSSTCPNCREPIPQWQGSSEIVSNLWNSRWLHNPFS